MLPNIPAEKKLKVRFVGSFKDGQLKSRLKEAGFSFYEIDGSVVRPDSVGFMSENLYRQCLNSGAELEVLETVYKLKKEEPVEEPVEELEGIELEILNMTNGAYELAVQNDLSGQDVALYLVDVAGIDAEDVIEHRVIKSDIEDLIIKRED